MDSLRKLCVIIITYKLKQYHILSERITTTLGPFTRRAMESPVNILLFYSSYPNVAFLYDNIILIVGFSAQNTYAVIHVTVGPDREVTVGSSVTLECQYTGVPDASSIIVTWQYKSLQKQATTTILPYYGYNKSDMFWGNKERFEKAGKDITSEHAIMLKEATLADEGRYFCIVEHYIGSDYTEAKNSLQIDIIGMLFIFAY